MPPKLSRVESTDSMSGRRRHQAQLERAALAGLARRVDRAAPWRHDLARGVAELGDAVAAGAVVGDRDQRPCSVGGGADRKRRAGELARGVGAHLSLIHISEPTRLLSISYAVFCLKKK